MSGKSCRMRSRTLCPRTCDMSYGAPLSPAVDVEVGEYNDEALRKVKTRILQVV